MDDPDFAFETLKFIKDPSTSPDWLTFGIYCQQLLFSKIKDIINETNNSYINSWVIFPTSWLATSTFTIFDNNYNEPWFSVQKMLRRTFPRYDLFFSRYPCCKFVIPEFNKTINERLPHFWCIIKSKPIKTLESENIEIKDIKLWDKIIGCFIGGLIGDAINNDWKLTSNGQLLIIFCKYFVGILPGDEYNIAKGYVDWYSSKPKDIKQPNHNAFSGILQNESLEDIYRKMIEKSQRLNKGNFNNGCLARCILISLIGINNTNITDEHINIFVNKIVSLTNIHPICINICQIVVLIIRMILKDIDKNNIYNFVYNRNQDNLIKEILQIGKVRPFPTLSEEYNIINIDGPEKSYIGIPFQLVIYELFNSKSYKESILNLKGDKSTNGIILGAVLGAIWGRENIPDEWCEKIFKNDMKKHIMKLINYHY
jgi:ADP-ribosylglycohydrolase